MTELTQVSRDAYMSGEKSPYLATSDKDMAHKIGLWLHKQGYSVPFLVHASRGYTFKVSAGGHKLLLSYKESSEYPTLL